MCGIAGVINKKKTVNVGEQMGLMLQGLNIGDLTQQDMLCTEHL